MRSISILQTFAAPRTTAEQLAAADTVLLVDVERFVMRPGVGLVWSRQFLDKLGPMLAASRKGG